MSATILRILSVLCLGLSIGIGQGVAPSQGAVTGQLSSKFLARGEQALFEIGVEGRQPDQMPRVPAVSDVAIESLGFGPPRMRPGRRMQSSFQYLVSSYEVGKHVIPPVEVMIGGVRMITEPVTFEVFDPNELVWSQAESQPTALRDTFRYASIIKVSDQKVYENQTVQAEIKLYVPLELARAVADWGIPEYERDGVAAWRFEPAETRGQVNLLGQPYVSLAYPTTMTALRSGEVELGPATVRLTYMKMTFDRSAQPVKAEATLEIPKITFEVASLPEGAPAGFDNAVGQFTLGTAIKQTDVVEGEPLAVDVIVMGKGNLDNLRSPQLIDESGWKVYDATATQRGEERRNISGTVVFSQFIRPLEMKSAVPPFRLVYFDPEAAEYRITTTEPIPLSMTPAMGGRVVETSGPPQGRPLPVERMTDILGLIDTDEILVQSRRNLPGWLGHAAAALVAFGLIARAMWMRYGYWFEKDEVKTRKREEYRRLSRTTPKDGVGFLRSAGGFVDKWLSPEQDAELRGILAERDQLCFRESKAEAAVPRKRREEILRTLRRAAFGMVVFAITIFPTVSGAEVGMQAKEAYESAKYEEAARLWLEAGPYENLSADALYNIGNAAYRMGSPGQAALYYRRVLARDQTHGEARQNLRFLERKYGAITIDRPNYQYALAKFPASTWRGTLWAGGWLVVIGLLVFPATRRGSRWRVAGVFAFVVGPLLMSFGALGWKYYPDDADFAPLARQAVITGDKVVLHTDAARTSPEVIDAPPGSLAEVIQSSGRWAYVSFATKTRGWVPVESIEMIIPETKPGPPKANKIAADGSNA